ncbi:MAG: queuosine precursor transporter [Lachnospiraceae bacterium]|nr:queuosine precursor transporter [Lachnospiraceae bacterium]
MPNELIFAATVLAFLGSVLLMYKLFGKNGLFVFAVFSTLLGNIAVCKCIDLFGLSTTAGNVLYASTFLVTDILSEKYGKKEARKAVFYCFAVMILWLFGSQLILYFTPNVNDYLNPGLELVFGIAPRVTIASLVGFLCSQNVDVFMYHLIWKKTGENKSKLWLRNNGSTLLSQAVDSVLFVFLAFWGTYPTDVFVSVLVTTYLFKALVALVDTPFVYIARRLSPIERNE